MEILSFNVNQFLKKESWNKYKVEEKNILQKKNGSELAAYIMDFLHQDQENLAILQEVPYSSSEKFKEIEKIFQSCIIVKPIALQSRKANFVTIAVSSKESHWNELPNEESISLSNRIKKKPVPLYYNRIVAIKNKDLIVIGTHIPAASYSPDASVLWDDIFYYCKQKNPQIIIGDLNVDKEDTIQNRKLSELKSIGYKEANGTATRTSPGHPPTCDTGAHVDYALVKNINIGAYVIDKAHTCLSDHYPIILTIEKQI